MTVPTGVHRVGGLLMRSNGELAFECVDGGCVEDIAVDGMELADGVREPIFIRSDLRQVGMHSVRTKPNTLNRLRNIRISNVRGQALEARIAE